MKLLTLLFLGFILVGCTTVQEQTPMLSFVIERAGGSYVDPIMHKDWMQTEFGWYIKRNPNITGDLINYKALVDLRDKKAGLLRQFNNNPVLKKNYPSFIHHVGEVNCRSGDNVFIEVKLMEDFKTIKSTSTLRETSEISKSLCIFKLATDVK